MKLNYLSAKKKLQKHELLNLFMIKVIPDVVNI